MHQPTVCTGASKRNIEIGSKDYVMLRALAVEQQIRVLYLENISQELDGISGFGCVIYQSRATSCGNAVGSYE